MSTPLSTHLPQIHGGIATIPAATGTLVVDTGLRNLQSLTCSLAEDAAATAATVSWELVTQVAGTTRKATLKTWAANGIAAGSTAAKVSWKAIGK